MIYWKLFLSFFKLGAFGFGGGYALIALLEQEISRNYSWIPTAEIVDILAISEMTPGPVSINAATFFGYRVGGIAGSIVATLSIILPSFIIMSLLLYIMNKYKGSKYIDWFLAGVRPIVLGLISSGAMAIARGGFNDFKSIALAIIGFYLVTFKNLNAIYAIILAGITGVILY